MTMEPISEKHDMSENDVVLVEEDEQIRFEGVNALTSFGFGPDRIHSAVNGDEAVDKVKELQDASAQAKPLVVFVSSAARPRFLEHKCRHPVFIVCTDAASTEATATAGGNETWNMTAPKQLSQDTLLQCYQVFSEWRVAETSKEQRMKKFHELAARKKQARGADRAQGIGARGPRPAASFAGTVPSPASQGQLSTAASAVPSPPKAKAAPRDGHLDALSAGFARHTSPLSPFGQPRTECMGYVDLGGNVHTGLTPITDESPQLSTPATSARGNSLNALSLLLPARSPFEEIHIIELAGQGSYGSVYKARWDAAVVALKVVTHPEKRKDTDLSFEGALSASLAHPNLVQTFKYSIRSVNDDSKAQGCEVWIVQEWCGMGTLGDKSIVRKISQRGGFKCIAEVCCEIASACSYLHSRGIVHGDLSGNNVLLCVGHCAKGFVAKVGDFGMARVLGDNDALETKSMGTVSSMPPELFVNDRPSLTTKVDVYAFGILLWIMCKGELPFDGLEPPQIVVMVATGRGDLTLPPDVPTELQSVYRDCTARLPGARLPFDKVIPSLLAIYQ